MKNQVLILLILLFSHVFFSSPAFFQREKIVFNTTTLSRYITVNTTNLSIHNRIPGAPYEFTITALLDIPKEAFDGILSNFLGFGILGYTQEPNLYFVDTNGNLTKAVVTYHTCQIGLCRKEFTFRLLYVPSTNFSQSDSWSFTLDAFSFTEEEELMLLNRSSTKNEDIVDVSRIIYDISSGVSGITSNLSLTSHEVIDISSLGKELLPSKVLGLDSINKSNNSGVSTSKQKSKDLLSVVNDIFDQGREYVSNLRNGKNVESANREAGLWVFIMLLILITVFVVLYISTWRLKHEKHMNK